MNLFRLTWPFRTTRDAANAVQFDPELLAETRKSYRHLLNRAAEEDLCHTINNALDDVRANVRHISKAIHPTIAEFIIDNIPNIENNYDVSFNALCACIEISEDVPELRNKSAELLRRLVNNNIDSNPEIISGVVHKIIENEPEKAITKEIKSAWSHAVNELFERNPVYGIGAAMLSIEVAGNYINRTNMLRDIYRGDSYYKDLASKVVLMGGEFQECAAGICACMTDSYIKANRGKALSLFNASWRSLSSGDLCTTFESQKLITSENITDNYLVRRIACKAAIAYSNQSNG